MRTDACEASSWLPTRTVAGVLGVTPRTVYGLVNDGALPAFKVGRLIRFRAADVDAYLEGARVAPGALDHLVLPSGRRDPSVVSSALDEVGDGGGGDQAEFGEAGLE